MTSAVAAGLALVLALPAAGLKVDSRMQRVAVPGQTEPTKQAACNECLQHAEHLDKPDECVCFASDVMGTFANDATKTLTTRKEFGTETEQTGMDRLPEGWLWHCRPISDSGAWEQCL